MRRTLFAICFVAAIVRAQDVPTGDSTRPDAQPQSPATTQPESPKPAATQSAPASSVAASSGPQLLKRDGSPVQPLSSSPSVLVTTYERHDQMRRDRDEEFAVLLCRPFGKLKTCPLWFVDKDSNLVPLTLELKEVEGLTVRYREGKEYLSEPDGAPAHTSQGQEIFRFKVRASRDFHLGATTLEGKLTYQRILDGKLSVPETIDVSIPVTVVKHDTTVAESYWAIEPPKRNPLAPLGDALLYVVAVPLLLPFIIGCSIHSNCE